VLYQLS